MKPLSERMEAISRAICATLTRIHRLGMSYGEECAETHLLHARRRAGRPDRSDFGFGPLTPIGAVPDAALTTEEIVAERELAETRRRRVVFAGWCPAEDRAAIADALIVSDIDAEPDWLVDPTTPTPSAMLASHGAADSIRVMATKGIDDNCISWLGGSIAMYPWYAGVLAIDAVPRPVAIAAVVRAVAEKPRVGGRCAHVVRRLHATTDEIAVAIAGMPETPPMPLLAWVATLELVS